MSLLLGITGKIGAGKNAVASLLEKRGWHTLDLDTVAHRVLNLAVPQIKREFGSEVINSQGAVDRRVLGAKVFGNPQLLEKLESLTYPLIEEETDKWIAEKSHAPRAVHAINLHKTSHLERYDAIIWVHAPYLVRCKRVIARDKKTWSELKTRFLRQRGLSAKFFLPYAETFRVRNSGNLKRLEHRLDAILHRL